MGVTEEQSHDKCALVHKFQIKSAGKKIRTVLGGLKVKDDVVHTVSYKCFLDALASLDFTLVSK